ncbi:unnamed protein product [marine sediment metagenome]|uniref:Uncharacterized protein n=1 Tax=marine sediment metagenome TaxID=412755 RepID=X0SWH5_9ZZZZ
MIVYQSTDTQGTEQALARMLVELKKANIHLASASDIDIENKDIDED